MGEVARASEVDPRGRGRPSRRTAVLGALFVALVGLVGWAVFAAQQRGHVVVFYDAQPVDCVAGTTALESLDHFTGDPQVQAVIDATEDVDCRLRFHVANRGRVDVTLRQVVLPFYGATTGASLHAVHLSPLGAEPLAQDRDGLPALDATFAIDHPLAPQGSVELTLHLRFNPDGCMQPDSTMTVGASPVVAVEVLGLTGERAPATTPFTQRGTADSDCSPGG